MRTSVKLHPHQAAVLFDTDHRIIVSIGGVGSGKTMCDGLILLDRASWDTGQLVGLFANSVTQLENGVLPEIFRWLEAAGEEYEYNHQPPEAWRIEWRERGIAVPPRPANFRRILTLRSGLHVLCGTLFNKSYLQYRTLQFGAAIVEEFTNGPTLRAVEFIAERVRCGQRAICAAKHRHQLYLVGNPPDDASHWVFEYLNRAELAAEKHAGAPDEERGTAERGTFPMITEGVGNLVLVQSATYANAAHLSEGYAETLAETYDSETARRRLGGELLRVTTGRAAESFSSKNIMRVGYDPARTLYVCLDFDMEPAVAALGHPLVPGEYPGEHLRAGREAIGIFGEYVNTDGISVRRMAEMLVKGDRGSGLAYRDERLRGLPVNWQGLRGQTVRFIAYGDATGNFRSKAADNLESSWQIVGDVFRQVTDANRNGLYSRDVAEFNPAPRARMNSFNARMESATKIISLYIDPRCEQLIADCEQCVWDELGTRLKKWGRRAGGTLYARGHLLDAVSYLTHQRFPRGNDRTHDGNALQALKAYSEPQLKEPRMW